MELDAIGSGKLHAAGRVQIDLDGMGSAGRNAPDLGELAHSVSSELKSEAHKSASSSGTGLGGKLKCG